MEPQEVAQDAINHDDPSATEGTVAREEEEKESVDDYPDEEGDLVAPLVSSVDSSADLWCCDCEHIGIVDAVEIYGPFSRKP